MFLLLTPVLIAGGSLPGSKSVLITEQQVKDCLSTLRKEVCREHQMHGMHSS
jgi:hypothetical protein